MARVTTGAAEDSPGTAPALTTPATLPRTQTGGPSRAFDSLRVPHFRWFWIAYVFSFFAMQMDAMAKGWLVYNLTGSMLKLGLVSLAGGLPLLVVAPVAGVLADRLPKRNLIILAQGVAMLSTLALAILIASNTVQFWQVLVTSVVFGSAFAFSIPARQSIVSELVERPQVMNAVALSSGAMNLARIAAPALAGLMVARLGMAGVYFIIAALMTLGVSLLLPLPRDTRPEDQAGVLKARSAGMARDMLEGFGYVRRTPVLLTLITLAFIPVLFGMPYQMLMPIFAKDVFKVDAEGLGYLMAASGVGAIIGSFLIASFTGFKHKGWLLIGGGTLFGVSLVLFGLTTAFGPALFWMAIVGLTGTGYMMVNNTLVQVYAADEMRGRVISVLMMTWGLMQVGTLLLSSIAQGAGPDKAIIIGGSIVAAAIVISALTRPALRRLT